MSRLYVNSIQNASGGTLFPASAGTIVQCVPYILRDAYRIERSEVETQFMHWNFNKLNSSSNSKVIIEAVRLGRNTVSGVGGEYIRHIGDTSYRPTNLDQCYQTSTYPNMAKGLFEFTGLAAGGHRFEFGFRTQNSTSQYPLQSYNARGGENDDRGRNQATSIIMYEVLL